MSIPIITPHGFSSSDISPFEGMSLGISSINIPNISLERFMTDSYNLDIEIPIEKIREPEIIKKQILEENIPTKSLPIVPINEGVKPYMSEDEKGGIIKLPEGSTIIKEKKVIIPEQISTVPYSTLAYKHDIEHNKNEVLSSIELNRLIKGKTSIKNDSYKLDELKEFAKKLGINVNQNKDPLIDAIREMKLTYMGQFKK